MTHLKRSNAKKSLLVMPFLMVSMISFAKPDPDMERMKKGNETVFKGHHFYWKDGGADSVEVKDRTTGQIKTVTMKRGPEVTKMDKEPVFAYENMSANPSLQDNAMGIDEYIKNKFVEAVPERLDTISEITISNVVVDANGKIMYYDLSYLGETKANNNVHQSATSNERLDPIMDKILASCPPVETNMKDGKPVPTYFRFLTKVTLKKVSFQVKAVPVQQK